MVFGVLMAIYRFHLNEIAKTEKYRMGFMRIRVAAYNSENKGFDTEVRTSLTDGAFDYDQGTKGKKISNPMPGNPTSDISTVLINKFVEGFDVKPKK